MTTIESVRTVSVADLRDQLTDGAEIAVIDIREGDGYATGHISVAVPVTDSALELEIGTRVPRRTVRLVVTDASGGSAARSAAARLSTLGYTDVKVLDGGVQAWGAAGFELITGLNSLSKALGEFVERRHHTPRITVEELKAKQDAGEDLIVLDTRPIPEYRHIAIPGGRPAPGAELLYRVFDQVPSPTTQVVVNCAGRTRAIIGAQALINAGLPNPVVSLENGTSAWLFAGYEPVQGSAELIDAPSPDALRRSSEAAANLRKRFDVPVLTTAELKTLRDDAAERTLYIFDVRTPEEFAAGRLPGAVSAPGGQLVQATDHYIGTQHARVVLTDSADLVRSSITASWLRQLGLTEVSVYATPAGELLSGDDVSANTAAGLPNSTSEEVPPTITAAELRSRLDANDTLTVLDLQPPVPPFQSRHHIPGSSVARRSTLLHNPEALREYLTRGPVVLVDGDGRLSRLAALDLNGTDLNGTGTILVLDGGIRAWQDAGLPTKTDTSQTPLTPDDRLPAPPDLETRKKSFADYVAWGDTITDQLKRDGIVEFRDFPPLTQEP